MSKFSDVMHKAAQIQQQLEAEGYEESDILVSLESETDLLDYFDRVAEKVVADDRLAASAAERAKRLKARADKRKDLLMFMMDIMGVKKLERPLVTASVQKNPVSLTILGEVPDLYMMSVPDKAAIIKALKAGETVQNAELAPEKFHLRMGTI